MRLYAAALLLAVFGAGCPAHLPLPFQGRHSEAVNFEHFTVVSGPELVKEGPRAGWLQFGLAKAGARSLDSGVPTNELMAMVSSIRRNLGDVPALLADLEALEDLAAVQVPAAAEVVVYCDPATKVYPHCARLQLLDHVRRLVAWFDAGTVLAEDLHTEDHAGRMWEVLTP